MAVAVDERVLAQAEANELAAIVKKVEAGRVLSLRERAMLEAARPKEERFELQAETPAGPYAGLMQAELAELWGYSLRQIKNWVKDGRDAKDPCPFNRPGDVPAWFARIYAPREAPARLVAKARELAAGVPAKAPEKRGGDILAAVEDGELGMLAMLNRLRTSEARMYREYEKLVAEGDATRAQFVFSEWAKVAEKLRSAEKGAGKVLEDLGVYVRKSEVAKELIGLHEAVKKTVRSELRNARAVFAQTEDVREYNAAVDRVIEEMGRRMAETSFVEPLELE